MADDYAVQREALIETLEAEGLTLNGLRDTVLRVERERFLPEQVAPFAYYEQDLIIDDALLALNIKTSLEILSFAQLEKGMRVLLVGSCAGYEEALILTLGCTLEVLEPDEQARSYAQERLREQSYEVPSYHAHVGDVQGEFDRIVAIKSLEHAQKRLFDLAPRGEVIVALGEEKVLVVMKPDEPALRFIGSVWIPPLNMRAFST